MSWARCSRGVWRGVECRLDTDSTLHLTLCGLESGSEAHYIIIGSSAIECTIQRIPPLTKRTRKD